MPNTLTPELSVRSWERSVVFYRDVIGFSIRYARPDEGFALLEFGQAELMIDQIGLGRDFEAGLRGRRRLGAGLNLQLAVPNVEAVYRRVLDARSRVAVGLEERWYRRGAEEVGQRQFVVADPDGYLIRPAEAIGTRQIGGV